MEKLTAQNSTYVTVGYGTYKVLLSKYAGTGKLWKESYNPENQTTKLHIHNDLKQDLTKIIDYFTIGQKNEITEYKEMYEKAIHELREKQQEHQEELEKMLEKHKKENEKQNEYIVEIKRFFCEKTGITGFNEAEFENFRKKIAEEPDLGF